MYFNHFSQFIKMNKTLRKISINSIKLKNDMPKKRPKIPPMLATKSGTDIFGCSVMIVSLSSLKNIFTDTIRLRKSS